jgi:Na+/melibiose symporter-like transporter
VRNPFASPLWSNAAFVRVWSAATISIFGSLITGIAFPFVAIVVLGAGALEVALLRTLDLGATLIFGLVAGAWVDRLRRRPVLIWADLGRAVLLGSVPVAFVAGVLSFPQLLIVTAAAAILTTFFDAADNAYLPAIVEREQLVEANSAVRASGSVAEFVSFGIAGFLVQILSGPITIAIDAMSFLASALLLGSIRKEEAPPPPVADRESVLNEIRDGIRVVRGDPILRAFIGAEMAHSITWGIFGAIWFLYVLEELHFGPAAIGVIAGIGGASAFIGAVTASRATHRWGVGPVAIRAMLLSALGTAFIAIAPTGLPVVAFACLVAQQLIADSAMTVYEITEVSVRQSLVEDRALGRVSSTFHVASVMVQLVAALAAGVLADAIGLRPTAWLGPIGALLAAVILWFSPARGLVVLPEQRGTVPSVDPLVVAAEVDLDRPPGA